MTTFMETPRFPDSISYGSSGGPGFKTHIFDGHTGIESRSQIWSLARGRWDVAHGVKEKEQMDELRAFFLNARGRALGFRFKDHADYELVNQTIGVGTVDGKRVFPLIKVYPGANPYTRRIYKPIESTLVVRVNGAIKSPSTYAVSTLGVITFDVANAPPATHVVTATCEFDVPVRFDTDQMSAVHDGWLTESWSSIPIIELLEDEDMT